MTADNTDTRLEQCTSLWQMEIQRYFRIPFTLTTNMQQNLSEIYIYRTAYQIPRIQSENECKITSNKRNLTQTWKGTALPGIHHGGALL
jgi:hypothetical protein